MKKVGHSPGGAYGAPAPARLERSGAEPVPHRRRGCTTSGFTIIEVLMASLILMVGFIGLMEAVALTANSMEHARRQTLATQIIDHEIEELRLASWATISALPTASTTLVIDSQFDQARLALNDDKTATANVQFTLTRTVTSVDPVTNVREINFTVSWVVRTSRRDSGGNILTFTYARSNSAWAGKYGLHLSYRPS